jgi:RNA polymerase sigma-70 factor (ECF subfamily)
VASKLRDQTDVISDDSSDDALVAAARHDQQAFGRVYDRYLSPVYRYCYGRLGSREEAEDATSLVFARALAGLSTYRGSAFRSWLFAIAHNVVLNVRRDIALTYPLHLARDLATDEPDLAELAMQNELHVSIHRALEGLTEEQRNVVELRLVGLSGPEIAVALGRSHGAVRATQCRAVSRLRLLLGEPSMTEGDDGH